MHVLFITGNRRFFEEGSEERQLLQMLSDVTDSLHSVVLTTRSQGHAIEQIGPHAWLYPTNSFSSLLFYFDALSTVRKQVSYRGQLYADVILSDDPYMSGWIGTDIAARYGCPWVVNVHDYYWVKGSMRRMVWSRTSVMPLSLLLGRAARVCIFSRRAALALQRKATSEQKTKLFFLLDLYTEPQLPTVDIKAKYSEFNFVVLGFAARANLGLLLRSMALLRTRYPKAGLVLVGYDPASWGERRAVLSHGASAWVRFETIRPGSFPFQNANVFLYLASGEVEDELLIHVAAASCPIVALPSEVSRSLIEQGENGILARGADAQDLTQAIRTLNETPGLRERFQVNANMRLVEAQPSREALIAGLRDMLTFPAAAPEAPPMEEKPTQLLEKLTHRQTILEKLQAQLKKIRDHYTNI